MSRVENLTVHCGCGKKHVISVKHEAPLMCKKIEQALGDEKGQPWKLERHIEHQAFKKEKAQAAKDPAQQRLCAWCGKPFKHESKHMKCCTWDCYLKKKAQAEQAEAVKGMADQQLEVTPVEAAWQTTPEETKELLEKLES